MRQSKLKHTLGFIHSFAWVIFPFIIFSINGETEDLKEIFIGIDYSETNQLTINLLDAYLIFSIVYYFQDCFWSIRLKEYDILIHHISVMLVFIYGYGKHKMPSRMTFFYMPMFWSEVGAVFIHIKFLKPHSAIAHHMCFVIYFLSRIIMYPLYVFPDFYSATLNDNGIFVNEIYIGVGLSVLVQIFSIFIFITRFNLFIESFKETLLCTCKTPNSNGTARKNKKD